MHSCEPPSEEIAAWLKSYPSVEGRYGHLLLEQIASIDAHALRPYFASAHRDAREHFDSQTGVDLHPDAGADAPHAIYPKCLPPAARRGLFGEVVAGLITEHFQSDFVGGHAWKVPIFLFRYHADVEAYLFKLARDSTQARAVFGRFGSDFIALSFDANGEVVRFISGEAKWRASLTSAAVRTLLEGKLMPAAVAGAPRTRDGQGIWGQLNRDTTVPQGLRQLQRLLQARAPDEYSAAILSLDRILLVRGGTAVPRTNLVLLAGNAPAGHESGHPNLVWEALPPQYTAAHDLQVVELMLTDGEVLIDAIYDTLWDGDL